jgi:hypothetical protein
MEEAGMDTRNKIGGRDWHLAIILFNIAWSDPPHESKWIYLLQITQDDGEGASLFKYMKCYEGDGYYVTYLDLFWISFVIEHDPNLKHAWLESPYKWAHTLCNHLWNRWVHKEDWR